MHFSNGAAHLDGVEALALLLELALLLQKLVVAHAAAPVKGGAHRLQLLAQDQRLRMQRTAFIHILKDFAAPVGPSLVQGLAQGGPSMLHLA